MAVARERLPNSNTSSLATKQPLPHTPGTYGQQQCNPAEGTNGLLLQPPSLAILSTRPIRVRPTQSEHSGQRIDACERLSPPRSNSSRDNENHPISGRSPPVFLPRKLTRGAACTDKCAQASRATRTLGRSCRSDPMPCSSANPSSPCSALPPQTPPACSRQLLDEHGESFRIASKSNG